MTESFAYTLIPVIPETKVPALGAFGTYDIFDYGVDYRQGDTRQAGHVGSEKSRLLPIDVDEPHPYADGTMPPPFAGTHLGTLLLKLAPAFPLITYVSAAAPALKQHMYVDLRAWDGDWPQQWATRQWPYDVKTNGFVRAEPAYVPVHGTPAVLPNAVIGLILTAIDHDRALHDQLSLEHNGTAQGLATGASSRWSIDLPDHSITSDNELTAAIMSMVAHGLEDDEIFEEVDRVKAPLEDDWTDAQIQQKIDSARDKVGEEPLTVRRFMEAFVSPERCGQIEADAWANYELHQSRVAMGIPQPDFVPYYGEAPEAPVQDGTWAPKGGTEQDQALSGLDEVFRRGRYLYIKEHGRLALNQGDRWELLGDKGGAAGTLCSYLAWQMQDSPLPYDKQAAGELKKEAAGWKDDDAEWQDEETAAQRFEVKAKLTEYRRHEDYVKWRTSAQVSGIASKMGTLIDTHAVATSALSADNEPDILWAGGIPWDLRTCQPASHVKPSTLHFHTAKYVPDFSGRQTPLFDQWMTAVLPDDSVREWVLNMMGATLIGGGKFFPEFISQEGNTGKTSTVELLADVLGSYSEVLPEELLTGAQTHSEVYLRLKGKKLAYFDEQPGTGKVARNKIKSLAGSSKLSGRAVNGREVVSFKPSHTLFLTVNEDIQFDQDDALQMRIRRVYFKGGTQKVADAAKKIWNTSRSFRPEWEAEAPAVLAGLMLRCMAYTKDQNLVTAPPHVELELIEAVQEQDTVTEWLLSQVVAQPGARATNDLLRSTYTSWCKSVGVPDSKRVSSSTAFGKAMTKAVKSAGFSAQRFQTMHARGWEGLALSPVAQLAQ